jgi:hypothetical protein
MTRISIEEYKALIAKSETRSKYNNQKADFRGESFDSIKERDYYILLLDRERRGEIRDLKRQVSIVIQEAFTTPKGEKIRAITYKADFTYEDLDGVTHIIDVKGDPKTLTDVYKLKKKLLAYRGYYIEEVY